MKASLQKSKAYSKIFMDVKRFQISKTILKEKKYSKSHISSFQNLLKAIMISIVWNWHKNIFKDQWNRMRVQK